jgi:hypothetical protein
MFSHLYGLASTWSLLCRYFAILVFKPNFLVRVSLESFDSSTVCQRAIKKPSTKQMTAENFQRRSLKFIGREGCKTPCPEQAKLKIASKKQRSGMRRLNTGACSVESQENRKFCYY